MSSWAWLWLLAAIAVVRVAGFVFGLINVDECDFSLFGRLMLDGAIPYVGVVDNKPPLTYLAFGLANLVGGTRWILAVRVLGVLVVFLTSVVLFAAAKVWSGSSRPGWAAAWLAVAAGLCESPSVSAELLMNLPVAVALYCLARALRGAEGAEGPVRARWFAGAGAAAATAMLFKQQAAIFLAAVALALVWEEVRRRDSWGRVAIRLSWLAVGSAIPILLMAALFAKLGALAALWEWLFTRSFAQVGASSSQLSVGRALEALAVCVLGATLLPWILAMRGMRPVRDIFHRVLVVLLALTIAAVSMGGRFYEHYFLQFVPPLALLGARELISLRDGWPRARPWVRGAALALAMAPVLGHLAFTLWRGIGGGYPAQEPKVAAVAEWLSRNTLPSDRVFVWGDQSVIYCAANRLPGTRYLRTAFHVGDLDPVHVQRDSGFVPRVSKRDVENTLADLEARPPAVVVDTAPADIHKWSLFPLEVVPELKQYLLAHYRLEAAPAGATIYRWRGER